jgi:hypothetical protein
MQRYVLGASPGHPIDDPVERQLPPSGLDLYVCAVSPAVVCALRESDSTNNPLLMPHSTITVIYQDRLPDATPADRWATSWTPLGA